MVNIKNISKNPMAMENITTKANINRANQMRAISANITRQATIQATGFKKAAMNEFTKRMNTLGARKQKLTNQYKNLLNEQSKKQSYINTYANVPNKNELAAMRRGNVALRNAMKIIQSDLMNVNRNMYTLSKNRSRIQKKANNMAAKAVADMKNRIASQLRTTANKKISKRNNRNRRKARAGMKRVAGLNKLFRINNT